MTTTKAKKEGTATRLGRLEAEAERCLAELRDIGQAKRQSAWLKARRRVLQDQYAAIGNEMRALAL